MGRIFGRRPDRTAAIARGVKDILAPGEVVVAGVDVQTPGTLGAAMQGGASGAVAGAVGVPMTFSDASDADDGVADPAEVQADVDAGSETGGTGGSGTLPVTGGHQTLLVFGAIILLAAGALAILFARQGRIRITPLPRD